MTDRLNIVFLIPALGRGGAERQLVALARGLTDRGHRVVVTTYYSGGPLERDLIRAGVPLLTLGKRSRWDVVRQLSRAVEIARRERPDILHGYTSEPNALAVLLRPLLPRTAVVLGVRNSEMDLQRYGWSTRIAFRLEALLARFADLVVVNSRAGLGYAEQGGFPKGRIVVVPNGIDTERFRPDASAGRRKREEWGIGAEVPLVGLVGRLDPMKDHDTFVRAAAALSARRPKARFVCVGDGPLAERARLERLARGLGLGGRFTAISGCEDMPAAYSAFDVLVSSSAFGEGFPNVVAEAMACGVPCAVTDVGDSAAIVGETGEVVSPRDAAALAGAVERLLPRAAELGPLARRRIVDRFGLAALIVRSEQVFAEIALARRTQADPFPRERTEWPTTA